MGVKLDKPSKSPFNRSRFVSASLRVSSNHSFNSDAYALRQIASNYNEYDLQQKIDLEIKMREGTAKLLAACKHMNQSLEAAKSLLTSDIRLAEFKSELQNRKVVQKNKIRKIPIPSGKASISEIRIPLIWKDTDYFKNKGDYRRFAVFCLLQIGHEIYDSIMLNVDRNVTDICFEDSFHFHNIKPDFQFKLFVYARVMYNDLSMASTHRKFTQKISNSVSRSLGRKFTNLKDFDPESGPKFHLMATATLELKDASGAIKTHDLVLEDIDKNIQLPLFGQICCRLAVQPECQLKEYISGLVHFLDNSSRSTSDETLHWCSLKNFKLNLWTAKEELKNEPVFLKHTLSNTQPNIVIPIDSSIKLSYQADTISITQGDKSYIIKFVTGSSKDWYQHLTAVRENFIAWEPIAEYQMELAPPTQPRSQYFLRNRIPGALYDETPVQENEIRLKRHSKSFSNVSSNDSQLMNLFPKSVLRPSNKAS